MKKLMFLSLLLFCNAQLISVDLKDLRDSYGYPIKRNAMYWVTANANAAFIRTWATGSELPDLLTNDDDPYTTIIIRKKPNLINSILKRSVKIAPDCDASIKK